MACKKNNPKSAPAELTRGVQDLRGSSDCLLESAIDHVMLVELKLAFRDETSVADLKISHHDLSKDVGRAVMAVVDENRKNSDICREIVEIACDVGESSDVFSEAALSFLDSKLDSFGSLLAGGEERDCIGFMAIACEMVVRFFFTPKANCLTNRIIHKAKEVMWKYAECNSFYSHVETYCGSFMKRRCREDRINLWMCAYT